MLQYAPSTQATFWCPALLGLRSTIPVCEAWGYEYCSGSVTKNLTGWRKCPLLCVLGLLFVIKNQNNLYETMKWWVQVPAKGMNKEPILWLFLFIEVCLHLHHPVCLFFLVLGSKHKWNHLRLFCFQNFIVKIMKHTFYSSYITVSLSWIWEKNVSMVCCIVLESISFIWQFQIGMLENPSIRISELTLLNGPKKT